MTHPKVLSKEKIEQLAREHAGDPSCSSPWGNTFEFEPSELRSFTRAIESATLEALAKQEPASYSADAIYAAWKGCGLDIIRGTDWKRFIGMVPKLYLHPSPTHPPAQQEPFGYFKATPFGWTDCAETDEGAVALYERR